MAPAPVVVEPSPTPLVPPVKVLPKLVARPLTVTGPSGTLIVEATPRARILLGGQLLGTTPLRLKVGVGTHRLRVDYGSSSHQLMINIVEDRETTVRDSAD